MIVAPFRPRPRRLLAALLVLTGVSAPPLRGDWNQWRGPQRNGISDDTTPIAAELPESGLARLWESETIPADQEGGHASPVISEGRVYLAVVWHTRVPSPTRLIDDEVMSALGHRSTNELGPELARKMEEARKNIPARLRGEALDEWAKQWVKDNLSESQNLIYGTWVVQRFKQGKSALDLDILDKVNQRSGKPFANVAELMAWAEAGFEPAVRQKILQAVPDTIKVAKDVVACLNAADGRMLWKFEDAGEPTGRRTSSTCAVVNGRVFAAGSKHLYCVDAKEGKLVWKADMKSSGSGSSPLVDHDRVWVAAGSLACYSATDGKQLWAAKGLRGDVASPLLWRTSDGVQTLVFQTARDIVGLDPETGDRRWAIEGGGQSTPVAEGDHLVVYSGTKDVGLRCYLHRKDGPPEVRWSRWWLARRYSGSPIIYNDHVYLTCGGKHQCLALADGALKWEAEAESTITSPILLDGKILIVEQNGMFLRMIKADPSSYQTLGRAKIEALWCPTPAPWDGKLIIRTKDRLACLDLHASPVPAKP